MGEGGEDFWVLVGGRVYACIAARRRRMAAQCVPTPLPVGKPNETCSKVRSSAFVLQSEFSGVKANPRLLRGCEGRSASLPTNFGASSAVLLECVCAIGRQCSLPRGLERDHVTSAGCLPPYLRESASHRVSKARFSLAAVKLQRRARLSSLSARSGLVSFFRSLSLSSRGMWVLLRTLLAKKEK